MTSLAMNPANLFRVLFLVFAALIGTAVIAAEDTNAIQARMKQRLPQIDALKDRQAVGENNRGFLEARGPVNAAEQQAISDENSDRRAAYAAIAAQTRSNADTVGRARAEQLSAASKRGAWIQDEAGQWKQKT